MPAATTGSGKRTRYRSGALSSSAASRHVWPSPVVTSTGGTVPSASSHSSVASKGSVVTATGASSTRTGCCRSNSTPSRHTSPTLSVIR